MSEYQCSPEDLRDRRMTSVMRAVVNLCKKLQMPPDVVAEGSIRAAAVTLVAVRWSPADVAEVFRAFAAKLDELNLDPSTQQVIH